MVIVVSYWDTVTLSTDDSKNGVAARFSLAMIKNGPWMSEFTGCPKRSTSPWLVTRASNSPLISTSRTR